MTSLISFFTHKIFKILFALYVVIFSIIWLISSPVAKHFITPILAEQQLQLSDDASIRFNPFLMRVTLSDIVLFSTKDNQQETVLAFKDLTLQIALWQLALDNITLSKFSLSEGMLKVTRHDEHLVIAGIEISGEQKQAAETTELTAEESMEGLQSDEPQVEEATAAFPYQFVLPHFLLSEFDIEIEIDTQQQKNKAHHIKIEQFSLSSVKATQNQQEGNLTFNALIDNTKLSLAANTLLTAGKGDINSNIRLSNYQVKNLKRYAEQLTDLNGSLSFNSHQTITLADSGTNFRIKKVSLGLQNLLVGLPKQHLTLTDFENNFVDLEIDMQDKKITHLAGKSNIKLSGMAFSDNETKDSIAAFKTLNLEDIQFILDDEPSIDIADIVLDEFLFSKKTTMDAEAAKVAIEKINARAKEAGISISAESLVKLPPITELKQLTLNKLHIHENSIGIDSIIFDGLTGEVIVRPDKTLANMVSLGGEPQDEQEVDASESIEEAEENTDVIEEKIATSNEDLAEDSAKDNGFIFSLNELRFINDNTLVFTDFSVDPIYQRTLHLDTLELGALSNSKAKQEDKTPFTLAGRSNKYANFNLGGFLQPFAATPTYHIKGDFKEFSLPAISSYMKDSTGLEVKTGQLNLDLDVNLAGDELDGNVIVLLQALETALVDSEEAGNLIDQGALPLNMAMGMLKDSDGNVELDVPLSGSTSDPEFGLSSIVTLITQKAILSATQDYLMTTFVPYANVVSIAITAGEFALKLRFDDLEYQEKQIEPNSRQTTYLKEFMALMTDKEDTRVTICAISVPGDIDLKSGSPITDKAAIKRLIDIGEKREHAFKDYVIKEGKLKSSSILFCKPQIDNDEGAIPRIEISV